MSLNEDEELSGLEDSNEGLVFNLPGNHYAPAYSSRWTYPGSELLSPDDLKVLKHMNCSYLSSDKPVTLLALKQHAQSLTKLISKLSTTSVAVAVRELGRDDGSWGYQETESFDWLNDLQTPYDTGDELHHVPLYSLLNGIREESEDTGLRHHCPLAQAQDSGFLAEPERLRRPYQTHHNLVMHANECLEILDHEYSSTGGLMSILPTNAAQDSVELAGARNSLLGQWLMHHQHLVARMHELEINYANALEALGGEAVVPLQRRSGPDGMSQGREIAYPQDRFVLVNAGDDVTTYLHNRLDIAEAHVKQKEKMWKNAGVSGERIWFEERGGDLYARGLIPIDVLTRYYRLAGKGHEAPIFVMPVFDQHPSATATSRMEARPTVVSIVTPTWPKRVSEWEYKFKKQLDRAKEMELENRKLAREMAEMNDSMALLNEELRRSRNELTVLERTLAAVEPEQ
ncbi:hypothetical protein EDB81DRAFT_935238 [Dactylonectria macrodidyma]|uniref:Uncharacterized protein n=1 Tax=Dactylonectria macrodidyma TaxID=307937 RepID=A0A9P9J6P5_9HYPO|nr:hypothetical protein EDB81DRAFT_935238 [Dactylonectria macrodidyma]